ncbi:MAG: potassium channel protein [Cyanobacteria bacterium]|uniref:potassium channel family protein n=1 Tax=Geminocystis sp. TaxID=2664100 RepID=UPI001DD0C917|nr:potassium channel protein [Cyanobacteria bacterium CG_2015-22_32_23]NCQ05480.1 potassium channel protein [Cyanobacteria bacterium CG_2015-09_32_10]NCQ42199.1 potassium channel protein [Cyanobacteria bacterium CG_2015-04_32_10]
MQGSFKKVILGAILFVITMIFAIFGYVSFGWSLLESVYMVVITIFGVGYGEVQPLTTPTQKIFTMLVIIAGTSSAVYGVGGFIQMVTEGEINRAFEADRQRKTLANLENHVIICGFGHIGQVLAKQLNEGKEFFVIIDNDVENLTTAKNRSYLVQEGDATDENVLLEVGIQKAKVLATVLPNDATNVFITLTARELNPDLIILARGELPSTEKKLRLAGANHVVLPASVSGLRMANLITSPSMVDFLAQKEEQSYLNDLLMQINVQMEELVVGNTSRLVGRTIRELEIRGKGAFIVVALRRGNEPLITHPNPSLLLNSGDILIVLGHQEDLPQFARFYQLNRSK